MSPKPSDKLIDFISGVEIPATPEETDAIQPFSKRLVEDYGYPVERIRTRPQFSVKASPSAKGKKSYPIDIAVFSEDGHAADNLYIIVEGKSEGTNPEEGDDRQLFNYMNLSSATIGVWTDGSRLDVFQKVRGEDGSIEYKELPDLPRFGEAIEEIGLYRRAQLQKPQNLSVVFRGIRNHLAGNATGITRDEALARQLIDLVFCKIFDERFTPPEELLTFRVTPSDKPEDVAARIRTLFTKVKAKYDDVFDSSEEIELDSRSIVHVVGQLQNFALTEADRDAVGEAFEVFIGDTLKGGQGQFFTPRNVVRLMVTLIDPEPSDLVIDPACGPGGFLVESLRHKWDLINTQGEALGWSESALAEERQKCAISTLFGIEKDSFLARVAKAYMAVQGDGKGGIFCEDSLDQPNAWSAATRQQVSLNKFDVVLANPPFGEDIKVTGEAKLSQYELGHQYKEGAFTQKVLKSQNPSILFLERCIQLAKDGGMVGIILPETYFHAPQRRYIRDLLLTHNLVALIDLPHNTFRPFNNAKCIAVIIQKNSPQGDNVTMIAADQMGHNHKGEALYRYDQEEHQITEILWDDISDALSALVAEDDSEFVFDTASSEVKEADVLVPRYYWPRLNEEIPLPGQNYEWRTLNEFIEAGALFQRTGHGSPEADYKGRGIVPYIRVKDIVNWEVYRDRTSAIPEHIAEGLIRSAPVEPEDILYVARGSYRIGDVAIASPEDTNVALTREIHILRVLENDLGLDPFYLLYLLSSPEVGFQTRARVFLDTTLPNIGLRYLEIKLPWNLDQEERQAVSDELKRVIEARREGIRTLREFLPISYVSEQA